MMSFEHRSTSDKVYPQGMALGSIGKNTSSMVDVSTMQVLSTRIASSICR